MYVGVDFSGGAAAWRNKAKRSTVWVADLSTGERPGLLALRRVQCLPGDSEPFDKLIAHLRLATASAIDAPFSLQRTVLHGRKHRDILDEVRLLGRASDRPFPRGADLVQRVALLPEAIGHRFKPQRKCEEFWSGQGLNVRSTLWNGPRGGAPFTAACLALLAKAGLPIWPWVKEGRGIVAEAFPAAQIKRWTGRLPSYGRPDQTEVRRELTQAIGMHCDLGPLESTVLDSPDALDAVVAAFAARAVARGEVACPPPADHAEEGWIAVHA